VLSDDGDVKRVVVDDVDVDCVLTDVVVVDDAGVVLFCWSVVIVVIVFVEFGVVGLLPAGLVPLLEDILRLTL